MPTALINRESTMTTNANVFSKEFLAEAGVPRIELIEANIDTENFEQASAYFEQLKLDITIMVHSYPGWEQRILEDLTEKGGEQEAERVSQIMLNKQNSPERFFCVETDWPKKWQQDCLSIETEFEQKNRENVKNLCRQFYDEAVAVHDGLMSRITGLLSEYYRSYGSDVFEIMLSKVMNHGEGMDPEGTMPFREKVVQMIQFARVHLNRFEMVEDDEKVTFIQECCGSGAKQVRQGLYEEPRDGARIEQPSSVTYGFKNFPVYCCHEPVMEYASLKRNGVPVFIIDPAKDIGVQPCKIHMYKDPATIPDSYYERVGLNRDDIISSSR